MIRRLISVILIETFLLSSLGTEFVRAEPVIFSQMLLRARSVASDGSSRQELTDSLRTADSIETPQDVPAETPFGSEAELRRKISGQTFTPIRGGAQIETVYLSRDLALYVPRFTGALYLSDTARSEIDKNPFLKFSYQLANRLGFPLAISLKQKIKSAIQQVREDLVGSDPVGPALLQSYRLAEGLGPLVDPFRVLWDVSIKTKKGKVVDLPLVIVRERSNTFLIDDLKRLENSEEARQKIEEVFRLEETLWEKGIVNLDILFLRNARTRNGNVVLRDLGNLTQDGAHVLLLLERLHTGGFSRRFHPIEKGARRISRWVSPELGTYYKRRAYEVYSAENFLRHWPSPIPSASVSDGGDKVPEEGKQIPRWTIPRAALLGSFILVPSVYLSVSHFLEGYAFLRTHYTWQTDVTAGALIVGLSDMLGQWMAYRSKGVPILKKQLVLAAALGGLFGWTYGVFYHWIEPFSLWSRVGLAAFIGSAKGAVYALMVGKIKMSSLPRFRDHYRTRRQVEKFVTVMAFEIPLRFLRHVMIQGWVDPFYRQIVSFASNAILAPIGGWIFNRLQVPLPGLVQFLENTLARLGIDVRTKRAQDGGRQVSSAEVAREVAEAAREEKWKGESFMKSLFMGEFRPELLSPYPVQDPVDKAVGDATLAGLESFLKENVDPSQIDRNAKIPQDVIDGLFALGAFGMRIPKEYGGLGLSQTNYLRALQLTASYSPIVSALLSVHQSVGLPQPLKIVYAEAQKEGDRAIIEKTRRQMQKYYPEMATHALSAFSITEKEAGSDPSKASLRAERAPNGKGWILNGRKLWTTNGPIARYILVLARTPDQNGRPQLTAFIVDTNSPGLQRTRLEFSGLRGIENGELLMDNVYVSDEDVLWKEGKGLKIALATLNTGRLSIAAITLGTLKRSLNLARGYASRRIQWGKPIGQHEAMAQKIAGMARTIFALEAVLWHASLLVDQVPEEQLDIRLESSASKLETTELGWRIIDDLVQIFGGLGYETADSKGGRGERPIPVEQLFRDFRITRIFEGTSEIQHLFIAREATDFHFKRAKTLLNPKAPLSQKAAAFLRVGLFYLAWYPKQWIPRRLFLKGEERYLARMSQRLARHTFHQILRHGPGLERRQSVLFPLVDIGDKLYLSAAALARAESLKGKYPNAVALAERVVKETHHALKGRSLFPSLGILDRAEEQNYQLAQRVLAGEYAWLEEGIIPDPEFLPDEALREVLHSNDIPPRRARARDELLRRQASRDGGEKDNFIPYAEIEEALRSLGVPIQRSSDPVKGFIRFDAEGTLWVDPFVVDHPVPRVFFEKGLLPALQFEKLLLSRFGFGKETGAGTEDQEWTLEILGLQPFTQGIVSLSEEERGFIQEWVSARVTESPREDFLMLRRLLSLAEWIEQPEIQEGFVRDWLERARSPENPDRKPDGGRRIFFHDAIHPAVIQRPVAVESGV